MSDTLHNELQNIGLANMFRKLSADFGKITEECCTVLMKDTRSLNDDIYTGYAEKCEAVTLLIRNYLAFRTDVLQPYVFELQQKIETGHDCMHCSGKCHVQHNQLIANAIYTSREIKQLLCSVFETFPIFDNIRDDQDFRKQRISLMRLDKAITELIYLEEAYLLPGILKAQTAINARS